jgi:hypothetical protein
MDYKDKMSSKWASFHRATELNPTSQLFGGILCNIIDYVRAGGEIENMTLNDVFDMCSKVEGK